MKLLLMLLLVIGQVLIGQSFAENLPGHRGQRQPLTMMDPSDFDRTIISELEGQHEDLKRVKFFILNGETRLAQAHLIKLTHTQTRLRPVIYRYLGILKFIEGQFERSLFFLNQKDLTGLHYRKICVLKVLNMIVLDLNDDLESEWQRCALENYTHFNSDKLIWPEVLVQLKLKPKRGVTRVPFKNIRLGALDNPQLKIFLKLALYLNQEALVEGQIAELDQSQLEDSEIRELVGHLLFRRGSLAKSYRFIEDLKSPNAESIKGNLYLLRQKYELAYAQFKLSLEQKLNSQNAMERILPLAWLLGDWEEGSKIAERIIASPQTLINKMTLLSAFLTQKGDYDRALSVLQGITQRSRRGSEIEITQLYSLNALFKNQIHHARKYALSSCSQFDLVNCWTSFQLIQWDSFPLTIRRDEELPYRKEWETLSQSALVDPLKETVYVNQLDIEELDDKLIRLLPDAKTP